MAGSDTFRGCSFQAAFCVSLGLELLQGAADVLVVEGDEDIVDASLEDASGVARRIVQAKTKAEPYSWSPQEVADAVAAWIDTGDDGAEFRFVTDGSLGPAAQKKLLPAFRRLAEGTASEDDRSYLSSLGLDPDNPALQRVGLHSRVPSARTLLEQATLRVVELRQRSSSVSVEEARDVVLRLFSEVVLTSGEGAPGRRRLERSHVAEIVGVSLDAIDDAELWSEEAEAEYRDALSAQAPDPAWTLLDLLPAEHPAVLTFVLERNAEGEANVPLTAANLLERSDDLFLQGPAGAGKTTTLAQIRTEGLEKGELVIPVRVGSYVPGGLDELLRRTLERWSARPLAPGVVAQLLDRGALVLLDGVGELVEEQRRAVIDDLQRLREQHPDARFIVAGRNAAPFARASLSRFEVQSLDADRRREIADALAQDGKTIVPEIEARIGEAAGNPLLFAMAVGLYARGARPSSRAELFEGFMTGLQERPEGSSLSDAGRGVVEAACLGLRSEGRFSAERWWWLETVANARRSLIENGTIAASAPSAQELLGELLGLGLCQTVSGTSEIGMLHDLFGDWLAAEAVRHGLGELPAMFGESLEEATVFLAEVGALDMERLRLVVGNPVAAARAADAQPESAVDVDFANELWMRLCEHLGDYLRTPLERLRLRVLDVDPPLVLLADEEAEDDTGVAEAPVVCLAITPSSSLSVAVDLWLGVLRLAFLGESSEIPPRQPESTGDLAALIEEVIRARAAEVDRLVDEVAPILGDRVRREIGPAGIRGWLLPPEPHPVRPGVAETIDEHMLESFPTADGVHIECVSGPDDVPEVEFMTRSIAESMVRTYASRQAATAVSDALETIMPRFAP
jgi:hypothetical protein